MYAHSHTGRHWRDWWGREGESEVYRQKKRMCVCERERLKGLTKRLSIPPDDALVLSEVI